MSADRRVLGVSYRAHHLALAVVQGPEVLEVRRHEIPGGYRSQARLRTLIRQIVADYAIDHVVVEANRPLVPLARAVAPGTKALSLSDVTAHVLGSGPHPRQDLFKELVAAQPKLIRLVTVLPGARRIAESERRRTVQLLSVALAIVGDSAGKRTRRAHGH